MKLSILSAFICLLGFNFYIMGSMAKEIHELPDMRISLEEMERHIEPVYTDIHIFELANARMQDNPPVPSMKPEYGYTKQARVELDRLVESLTGE